LCNESTIGPTVDPTTKSRAVVAVDKGTNVGVVGAGVVLNGRCCCCCCCDTDEDFHGGLIVLDGVLENPTRSDAMDADINARQTTLAYSSSLCYFTFGKSSRAGYESIDLD